MKAKEAFEVRGKRIMRRMVFETRAQAVASLAGVRGFAVISNKKIEPVFHFPGESPRFRSIDGQRQWFYGDFHRTIGAAKRAQLRAAKACLRRAQRELRDAQRVCSRLGAK